VTRFDDFFDEEYEPVVRALTLVFDDRHRAEDLAQFAFARAYRDWRRVSAMDRPVGWVYVVALNRGRRELRRAHPEQELETLAGIADPAATVATALTVQAALETLTTRQRAAIVLRYGSDLSLAEVASAMGCALGTVKATLHQALRRLRIELDEVNDDEA
jgi:RNA polymerase sigma factor (sigma-70 family)